MIAPKFIWLATIFATITAVTFARDTQKIADAVTIFLGKDDGDPITGWDSENPKHPNIN